MFKVLLLMFAPTIEAWDLFHLFYMIIIIIIIIIDHFTNFGILKLK